MSKNKTAASEDATREADNAEVTEAKRAAEVAELSNIPPAQRSEATNARLQELEVQRQQSLQKDSK